MSLTVRRQAGGTFAVVDDDQIISPGHETQSAAWRIVDRMEGEAVTPIEKRTDFAFRRSIDLLGASPRNDAPKFGKPRKKKQKGRVAKFATPKNRRRVRKLCEGDSVRDYRLGTFGAASPVRKISIEDYLRDTAKAAE